MSVFAGVRERARARTSARIDDDVGGGGVAVCVILLLRVRYVYALDTHSCASIPFCYKCDLQNTCKDDVSMTTFTDHATNILCVYTYFIL